MMFKTAKGTGNMRNEQETIFKKIAFEKQQTLRNKKTEDLVRIGRKLA